MTTDPAFPLLKTARLRRLAELVPACQGMIDVGTDHGLLPIALVQGGVAQRAIASDVLPDPLAIATSHIRAHRLEQRISPRQGDGLVTLAHGEAQVVTIAGMGIKSIMAILQAHPPHTLGAHTLIIQTPQIDNALREDLTQRYPWSFVHEELLWEAPQIYHMLKLDLTRAQDPVDEAHGEQLDAMVSPYLQRHQDVPTLLRAVRWLTHRKQLRLDGLQRARRAPDEKLLSQTRAELAALDDYAHTLRTRQG